MASPKSKRLKTPKTLSARALSGDFPRGSSVLIGLSGGADSVALTRLLAELAAKQELELSACHINHRLRGAESESDSEFCEALCDSLEIPYIAVEIDVAELARSQKLGIEEAGRAARHFVFENLAEEEGIDLIALGHHADDQVETALFRLFRGSGPLGLLGIPRRRGRIIRPLLNYRREEIVKYLHDNGQSWREDISNLEESYTRNFIRNSVLPLIRTRFGAVDLAILRMIEINQAEEDQLDSELARVAPKVARFSPGGCGIVDIARFNKLGLWLKRRILRWTLETVAAGFVSVDFATIERLISVCDSGAGGASLPGTLRAKVERGALYITVSSGVKLKKRALKDIDSQKELALNEINAKLVCKPAKESQVRFERLKQGRKVFIDRSALVGNLSLRSLKTADRFTPLGMRGSRKLGEFLTDQKVPTALRGEIPLLCDDKGIIWVAGFQIADRVKLKKTRAGLGGSPLQVEIIYENNK